MADSQQTTMAEPTYSHHELVEERLVRWYFWMALLFLGISMLGGILMAAQLIHWNPFNGAELLSPGRWRMVHTNAIAYGFLANAFLGMLQWAVPRLTMQRPASKALSYFIFFAWQLIVLSTAVGLVVGPTFQNALGSPNWQRAGTLLFPSVLKVLSGARRHSGLTPSRYLGWHWWP